MLWNVANFTQYRFANSNNYYIVYAMLYSLFYSLIIISLYSVPSVQVSAMIILNGVYLILACLKPYTVRVLNILNIINHIIVFVCSLLMLPTLAADNYYDYPILASLSGLLVVILTFAMLCVNFGMLYTRLLPAFIKGLKKGCKFEQIRSFGRDDREIDAPSIVLPGRDGPGRIEYNEGQWGGNSHSIANDATADGVRVTSYAGSSTSAMDKTGTNMNKNESVTAEEYKSKSDTAKVRKNMYTDEAI